MKIKYAMIGFGGIAENRRPVKRPPKPLGLNGPQASMTFWRTKT